MPLLRFYSVSTVRLNNPRGKKLNVSPWRPILTIVIVISEQKMVIQSECGMLRYDRADLEGIMK